MSVLSVKIPESLEKQVAQYARRHGVSTSSVVREALRTLLEREAGSGGASFLEQAEDLVGIVDAAPDLSTNPAYLKGYGR